MSTLGFCRSSMDALSSGQLQAQAARTVAFLHLIESTIQRLTGNTEVLRTAIRESKRVVDHIRAEGPPTPLDPEGRACELLEQAAAVAERVYQRTVGQRDSANRDARLSDEDGVVDAFDQLVEALADFHNQIGELREAVLIHDARLAGPSGRVYDDVDAMFADIARAA